MKKLIIILLLLLSTKTYSQIQVDDVGDGWKNKVDSALSIIKKYDLNTYNLILDNCSKITYWIGDYSTIEETAILISVKDMNIKSLNNLACVIVHESYHIYFLKNKFNFNINDEETICYRLEYDFICKIPNSEAWLKQNAIKNMIKYGSKL